MAKVIFQGFGENKEVEASVGEILLRAAKKNGIPLPLQCEDGECGTCVVRVKLLTKDAPTERLDSEGKELRTLVGMGHITRQEAEWYEMYDTAPDIRLACQTIIRCDMIVKPI